MTDVEGTGESPNTKQSPTDADETIINSVLDAERTRIIYKYQPRQTCKYLQHDLTQISNKRNTNQMNVVSCQMKLEFMISTIFHPRASHAVTDMSRGHV
jgi:hypothetical protein